MALRALWVYAVVLCIEVVHDRSVYCVRNVRLCVLAVEYCVVCSVAHVVLLCVLMLYDIVVCSVCIVLSCVGC